MTMASPGATMGTASERRRLRKDGQSLSTEGMMEWFRGPWDTLEGALMCHDGERLPLLLPAEDAIPGDEQDAGVGPSPSSPLEASDPKNLGFAASAGDEALEKNLPMPGVLLPVLGEADGGRGCMAGPAGDPGLWGRGPAGTDELVDGRCGSASSFFGAADCGPPGGAARQGLACWTSPMTSMADLQEGRSSGSFARNIRMTRLSCAVTARWPGKVTLHSLVMRRIWVLPLSASSKGVQPKVVK
mmetsp:Transcript_13365/g.38013  ORF Transcript_13365/g.38013 Transcript_13365/m.38013 type:complete len:244 (-) Transcript_13365:404-1135(-)